jgi:hypothetical protein
VRSGIDKKLFPGLLPSPKGAAAITACQPARGAVQVPEAKEVSYNGKEESSKEGSEEKGSSEEKEITK